MTSVQTPLIQKARRINTALMIVLDSLTQSTQHTNQAEKTLSTARAQQLSGPLLKRIK
jgi:hypothetical protein